MISDTGSVNKATRTATLRIRRDCRASYLRSTHRDCPRFQSPLTPRKPLGEFVVLWAFGRKEAVAPNSENTPGKARTCNLRFRRPMLYPIELRVHGDQIDFACEMILPQVSWVE